MLEQIADKRSWQIVSIEVMPDHVHPFVRVDPADAPASMLRGLTARTTRLLRQELPYLRDRVKVLWSPSYFGASVGYVSESTVHCYIEQQWNAVMAS